MEGLGVGDVLRLPEVGTDTGVLELVARLQEQLPVPRRLAEVELRLLDRAVAESLLEELDVRLLVRGHGPEEVLLDALAEEPLAPAVVPRGLDVEIALQVLEREREVQDPDVA